jgi:phosphatidylglycerol lysyltransferase
MNEFFKRQIQNIAIGLLVIISFGNLFAALPLKFAKTFEQLYDKMIDPNMMVAHGILSFWLGVLMLLLAYSLYRRVRSAWVIETVVLFTTVILQILHFHRFTVPIVLIELFVLAVLILSYRDFSRLPNRVTLKWAFIFIGMSLALLLANASIGLYIMRGHINDVHTLYNALMSSIDLLMFMDTSVLDIHSKAGQIYADSLIIINWICIFTSVLLLLKPLVYDYIHNKQDKERVRKLVLEYGQNPMSYLALENDKRYFFSKSVEGVCSYTIVGKTMVCCGDMICSQNDGFAFLNELLVFSKQNGLDLLLLNITDYFIDLYKTAQFGILKYGEDACFNVSEYSLKGGKVAKVRAAINHANKSGISVLEYHPLGAHQAEIEAEIREISDEWLKKKNAPEMSFMLGGINLEKPLDRRYFYARDINGKMLGFVVFLPYLRGKAYLAEVTRRRANAPQGVMEKIIYEAFQVMKEEGVETVNMGLSPLYNVASGDKATFNEKLFAYVYDNMNEAYDFKALHHAKEKYAPTSWEARFLAYYPKPFTPQFAYAMIKAQNPEKISKLVISQLKKPTEIE